MQGEKQYQEKLFVSFQLSSRVPEDNFYRRLKETLDLRFLRTQTKEYYGSEGQKSIDPVVFFKLMLIGYIENINSDRKIIETASMRLDMLYFIGYDIDEPLPWHSTLSRTRKLYGKDVFLDVFRTVLHLCVDKGMVDGRRQAIDSALVKSNASMDSLQQKTLLLESDAYYESLTVNEPDNSRNTETQETNHQGGSTEKPKPKKRNTVLSNEDFTSTTDPDARISKKKYKPLGLNFTAQISVDTSSHVICGAMADFSDKRDAQSMESILSQSEENLQSRAITVEEVLADTGYSSGEVLRLLERRSIKGYIPSFGMYKPKREGFTFHPQENFYTCSQGVRLEFKGVRKRSEGNKYVSQYRSLKSHCQACPLKESCLGKGRNKSLEDTVDKVFYDHMHKRTTSKQGQKMKTVRSATVEPVLGSLLDFNRMKKVYTKGIDLADKHVLLAACAYNIKKLLKFSLRNVIAKQAEQTTKWANEALNLTVWLLFCLMGLSLAKNPVGSGNG